MRRNKLRFSVSKLCGSVAKIEITVANLWFGVAKVGTAVAKPGPSDSPANGVGVTWRPAGSVRSVGDAGTGRRNNF